VLNRREEEKKNNRESLGVIRMKAMKEVEVLLEKKT